MPKVLNKTYKTNITQGKFKKFSKIKKENKQSESEVRD